MAVRKKRKTSAKSKKSNFLSRGAKMIVILATVLLTIYFSVGFFLDKGFIKRDLGEKFGKVLGATTLTIRFVGPPNKPVLSVVPVCINYFPYVELSWTSDYQTDYFDVDRNSVPLVAGIIEAEYEDGAVKALTNYTYVVTAFNSLGQNTSNSIVATALDCGASTLPPVLPDPTHLITKFQNTNLSGFQGTPKTKERRPSFYGTTNISDAEIDIVISGKTSIVATTSANANGYWIWRPQDKLNYGLHKIEATAIDPNDQTRKKMASLNFKVKEKDEESERTLTEETADETVSLVPPSGSVSTVIPSAEKIQLPEISVKVANPDKTAYPGRDLSVETEIKITDGVQPFDSELKYSIVDENYEEVFQVVDQIHVNGDKTIEKKLSIPRLLKPGKYKVLVSISRNGTTIVAEDSFSLREVSIVHLGGGLTITATQIMTNLFWVILWLLILLIIFLILLEIEYWMSKRAIIQITEEILREKGLITRKKIQ